MHIGAKNSFEKDFFKLMIMNSSVFGKTMENLRKRVDVQLVTDDKKLMVAKPTYVNRKLFTKDLEAVHKIKEVFTLDRQAYIGMCILDLSKVLMFDFHFNYIKKTYSSQLNYCLQIQTTFVTRLRLRMYMLICGLTKTSLISVITTKTTNIMIQQTKR